MMGRMTSQIFTLDTADLRARSSMKYRQYDADVLPLWVAEMDCALAPPIEQRLLEAVRIGDTGYRIVDGRLEQALAEYAAQHWRWQIDPEQVRVVGDVGVGMIELMRAHVDPGDRVVISSPIYPPFRSWTALAGGEVVDVPLRCEDDGWHFDLDGLRAAFAAGARVYLLCNPANPVGRAWRSEELGALADLAAEYDVLVIADEIHGPLALEGASFTPLLTVSDAAREVGVSVLAASKAWNLAGLKCAQVVSADGRSRERAGRIPPQSSSSAGHLGMLASERAWAAGGQWLEQAARELSANRDLLGELVATHLPQAGYVPAEATYLGWLDLSAYDWGADPAGKILTEARVALNPGPSFGATGAGFARINFACSPAVLTEAVERIGALAR